MASGARTKVGALIFASEVLWKQIYCIEGIICVVLLKIFSAPAVIRRPHSDFGARGTAFPLHPFVTPLNGIIVFVT